ncbi:MAG: pyridoxal-phosphate dependent enzyme [Planctomycetota bacterium]|nr:pyridoxal-phosphate dependent enzyme [Planctomycetota bacterium]
MSSSPGAAPGLVCAGCGQLVEAASPSPFRCPAAGSDDDLEHILVPEDAEEGPQGFVFEGDENPFLRYGELLLSKTAWGQQGEIERSWRECVGQIDASLEAVGGRGFRRTPYGPAPGLGAALGLGGALWIKDETGNVAGSHKGRHLMGVALHQEMAARSGLGECAGRPLAVASCGNAALAAAVIARAWADATAGELAAGGETAAAGCGELLAFVPAGADRRILARLGALGGRAVICERQGTEKGDPCLPAFRQAVESGALPFTCQGTENALVLDGGRTLAFEIAEQHSAASARPIGRVFVQVGGGALASSLASGLEQARKLGAAACAGPGSDARGGARGPALHPVQTAGCSPFARAWQRFVAGVQRRAFDAGEALPLPDAPASELAAWLVDKSAHTAAELAYAARHRSQFMWPWELTPKSAASGILDDETWDWLAILRATVHSGGWPLVVDEETVRQAAMLAQEHTGIAVDATGAAGLAGFMEWSRKQVGLAAGGASREQVVVIFTGGLGRGASPGSSPPDSPQVGGEA